MGFLELLTLLFIAFKLFHVVAWSWWVVFSPEIVAIAGYALIYFFFGAVLLGFVKFFFNPKKSKRPSGPSF
jgi:hypothetical protein